MSAEHTLRLLFPLELGGDHLANLRHDARFIDAAKVEIEALLQEIHGDATVVLLGDWERVLALTPGPEDTMQLRREQVVRKIRERGGLSRAYFTALGQAMGYDITLIEPLPFMAGWGGAGEELMDDVVVHQWGVEIIGQALYHFRAGESAVGERVLWWSSRDDLEALFDRLKPAHTFVYFSYQE